MAGLLPIGVPDGNVYPLMTALGKQNSRTKVYGWIAVKRQCEHIVEEQLPRLLRHLSQPPWS